MSVDFSSAFNTPPLHILLRSRPSVFDLNPWYSYVDAALRALETSESACGCLLRPLPCTGLQVYLRVVLYLRCCLFNIRMVIEENTRTDSYELF